MTSQSPRIYIYKITFDEVLYYYYGVHKEKKFGEYYMGSPKTHKWCWELYSPKKQILELFDYTDEGWLEANEIEQRLINPVYQSDKWCLNENCGGSVSLEIRRKNGKKVGTNHKNNSTGFFSLTEEERINNCKKAGLKSKEEGKGVFSRTKEEMSQHGIKGGNSCKNNKKGIFSYDEEKIKENGRKGGEQTKLNQSGIFSLTKEQRQENSKKGLAKHKENSTGLYSLSAEQIRENGRKGAMKIKENGSGIYSIPKEKRQEYGRKTNLQRWICTETGFITSPGALSRYQKSRDIDVSNRKRIF
jgi:general stress protein YciG